ncbi:MAG TPA: hypothetical protein ACFYD3_04490 [Candidatus Hypogeohydataceae bacterium YC41]
MKKKAVVLFGLGLDGKDGHKRITKGEDFLIYGGSKETHEHMVEKAQEFKEAVKETGKQLGELSPMEYRGIIEKLGESNLNWLCPED